MTVAELVQQLSKYEQDREIWLSDPEYGLLPGNEFESRQVTIYKHPGSEWKEWQVCEQVNKNPKTLDIVLFSFD